MKLNGLTDMSMLELTPDFIKEFAAYLSTDAGKEPRVSQSKLLVCLQTAEKDVVCQEKPSFS